MANFDINPIGEASTTAKVKKNSTPVHYSGYVNRQDLSEDTFVCKEPPKVGNWKAISGRLPDDTVLEINKCRKVPHNMVVTMDSEQNFDLEYRTPLTGGTSRLPENFELKNNALGITNLYPIGYERFDLQKTGTEVGDRKIEGVPEVSNLDAIAKTIPEESVQKINEVGILPENLMITLQDNYRSESHGGNTRSKQKHSNFELACRAKIGGKLITGGTRILPNGYKLMNNKLGFTNIYPEGFESNFVESDNSEIQSSGRKINFGKAITNRLSKEEIAQTNKTRKLPDNMMISMDPYGKLLLTYKDELTDGKFFGGTNILPKGYELKNDTLGFTNLYPIGYRSYTVKSE